MKVCLYCEAQSMIKTSGIGRALEHQKEALNIAGIEYTTNINDDYDILHINTLLINSYAVLKKAIRNNKKVIVHGHSTQEDYRNSFRFWRLTKFFYNRMILNMYRKSKYIITPTEYSKKLISSYKGVNAKIYSVSNGIMLDKYSYSQECVDKFRTHFNITNEKIIMSVGLLFERKGILDFFDVARSMPDYKFIWFGHVPKVFCENKITKAIKCKPNNVIMPGYIKGDIIRGAFSSADVFFFPTKEETEGIVVLEALGSKSPVVIRDIEVYQNWLVDGVNCLKGITNDDFKKSIEFLVNNSQYRQKQVDAGFDIAKTRSLEFIGQELKQIYEEVLYSK